MPDSGRIIGLARFPKNTQNLGVEIRTGEYDQPEALRASLAGVDVLLLVSGLDTPNGPHPAAPRM